MLCIYWHIETKGLVWLLALLEQFLHHHYLDLHTQPCKMAVDLQNVAGLLQASLDPAQNRQGTPVSASILELALSTMFEADLQNES